MPNITTFETEAHHIELAVFVNTEDGKRHRLKAIFDTGAPFSEFSDQSLSSLGLLSLPSEAGPVAIKAGLQTQKYGCLTLPSVELCGHEIRPWKVYISNFEKSWGIDALIGLDFVRHFRTTIDYQKGHVVTETLIR